MSRFNYVKAHSMNEAVELIGDPRIRGRALAGGTDLLVQLRQQAAWFDRLIDISQVQDLRRIESEGSRITLGTAVTFTQAIENEHLQQVVPLLVEACRSVGSPQIRNLGTLGGNVMNAAPCADSLPALVCLDATAHLRSLRGERTLPVSDLVIGPHQVDCKQDELLTHFSFEHPPEGVATKFIKLGRRNAQSISRLSIAAIGRVDDGGIIDFIRLTAGAATPQTNRLQSVEAMLIHQEAHPDLFTQAGQAVAKRMIEITGERWSTPYKSQALPALVERALAAVLLNGHGVRQVGR